MLVQYLYDRLYEPVNIKRPFGCIVALGKDHIGVSLCHPKDQFCKNIGRELAKKRACAKANIPLAPQNAIVHLDATNKRDYVRQQVNAMAERASKYFK
jgi:hypothetical protein